MMPDPFIHADHDKAKQYFHKNMLALEQTNPALHRILLSERGTGRLDEGEESEAIQVIPPPDGKKKALFILFGWNHGRLAKEVLRNYPGSMCVVIEASRNEFYTSLFLDDYSGFLGNKDNCLIVQQNHKDLTYQLMLYFDRDDHSDYLPTLSSAEIVGRKSHADYYRESGQAVRRAADLYWRTKIGNSFSDQMVGLRHVLNNMKSFDRMMMLNPYADKYAGRPGIVVSSGPSLEKALPILKEIQDKAVLIAADSCLKKLLENGIRPLGVTCVERHENVPKLFQGYRIPEAVTLFTSPVVSPIVIDSYPGPIGIVFRKCFPFDWFPPLMPQSNIGVSCSHYSYHVLRHLGCRDIFLVGQDLAYDRGSGHSHYHGMYAYATHGEAQRTKILVPDNQGGQIPSHEWWIVYRDIFSDYVLSHPETKLYNVIHKEAGAAINGVTRMDPEKLYDYCCGKALIETSLNPVPGKELMQGMLPLFEKEYAERCTRAKAQLKWLNEKFCCMKNVTDPENYLKMKRELLGQLDQHTHLLFSEATKSLTKRFDAGARSIWLQDEFIRNIPGHIDQLCECMKEISSVLGGD